MMESPAVSPMLVCLALLLALLLVACGGALPPAAPTTTPAPRMQAITRPAEAGWIETGARVEPDDQLVFEAGGAGILSKTDGSISPAGGAIPCDRGQAEPDAGARPGLLCLLDGAPFGVLIGRIGDGPPFVIGSAATVVAERGGTLLLAVNDCCSLADNAGAFSVTLVRDAD